MQKSTKTKAEQQFAASQKKDAAIRQEVESDRKKRAEKTARLKGLRLAKEAEDQEAAALVAAAKGKK